MKIWTRQHIVCPYCNSVQKQELNFNSSLQTEYMNLLCYPEEGGCDRHFVIEIRLEPILKHTYKLEPIE